MYEKPLGSLNHLDIYQEEVKRWCIETFGEAIATNINERCLRFIEEANELCQALGMTEEQAITIAKYVFSRPVGEPKQEVGGVMITLMALCNAADIGMDKAYATEAERCWQNMEKIRNKNLAKPLKGIGL